MFFRLPGADQKSLETVFPIANCRPTSKITRNSVFDCHLSPVVSSDFYPPLMIVLTLSGEKWQSKTLFLSIFDPPLSIVLKFSIAVYPACLCRRSKIFSRAIRCKIIPPFVSIGIVSSSVCVSTGHRESRQRLELS